MVNVVLWIVFPYYIGAYIAKAVPSTPLGIPSFIYGFGILITALQVAAALTEGMAVSVPFQSGTYLVTAAYVWFATNGGNLTFKAGGTDIALDFQLLLYILILPSIWGIFRVPLAYIIHRRAAVATMATTP